MKIVWLLLMAVALSACTRRVEYSSSTSPASPDSVNINIATAAELERLPHIGKKTAETIVEFRAQNGPFHRIEQLMLIRGISENRFREIRNYLRAE